MKKITILHYAYPPSFGGVENLMQEHALVLANLGYSVKVLTGSGKEADKRIELVEDPKLGAIRVFNPEMQDMIEEKGEFMEGFDELSQDVAGILEQELADCDVIIVHNVITLIHNLALNKELRNYFKKNPHKKIILWTHDSKYITEEKVKPNLPEIYHTEEVNKLLSGPVENAEYVAISEVFKDLLMKVIDIDPNHMKVIHGGVDLKSFVGASDKLWNWIMSKNTLDKFPIFFSPSNILERKNLEYDIDIFSEVKKKYPEAIYFISGKTSAHRDTKDYRSKLGQQIDKLGIKDSVYFLAEELNSPLEHDDIKALYRLSDAVLYLTKSENFGIPIIESAIFKTQIFTSNLKVFKEIAGERGIEYIDYKLASPEDAARIILKNIEESDSIKLNSDVRKKYNLQSLLEKSLIPLIEN